MDIIVCWPDNVDFPLWRQFIQVHRHYFQKVIVVWVKSNQSPSYKEFVEMAMGEDDITFLECPDVRDRDWRDVAVNFALEHSNSDWVWFTEQDIFVLHTNFWATVLLARKDHDAILYKDDDRIHPCMAFVKRNAIEQTKKNFGVVPDKSDHFSVFFNQLRLLPQLKITYIDNLNFYHMAGLSQNMSMLERGESIHHKPDEFKQYLQLCINSREDHNPLDEHFIELVKARYDV